MAEERLQKIIATAGIASRRKAEELITMGDVMVNGKVVTELGTKADLSRDHIKVFGKLIKPPARLVYLALNKPDSCVTTVTDPEGRKTVMEYVRGLKERVYPVGRLDYHSEGLLLFTNDGEFANRITSAKFHVQKTYLVKVTGNLDVEKLDKFRAGLPISGKRTAPAEIRLHKPGSNPWYEVKLTEGRQNQIRLMFRHLGLLVERLRRVRIGFVELGKLKTGTWRPLTDQEIYKLRHQVGLKESGGEPEDEGFIRESRTPYGGTERPIVAQPAAFVKAPRAAKYRRPKFLAAKPKSLPSPVETPTVRQGFVKPGLKVAPAKKHANFRDRSQGSGAKSRPAETQFSEAGGSKPGARGPKPPFSKFTSSKPQGGKGFGAKKRGPVKGANRNRPRPRP